MAYENKNDALDPHGITPSAVQSAKRPELRKFCRKLGLDDQGKTEELRERLLARLEQERPAPMKEAVQEALQTETVTKAMDAEPVNPSSPGLSCRFCGEPIQKTQTHCMACGKPTRHPKGG